MAKIEKILELGVGSLDVNIGKLDGATDDELQSLISEAARVDDRLALGLIAGIAICRSKDFFIDRHPGPTDGYYSPERAHARLHARVEYSDTYADVALEALGKIVND